MDATILAGALKTPGVLPARRRVDIGAETWGPSETTFTNIPKIPPPHVAAGGFSAVVEIAAAYCLRVWKSQVSDLQMIARFAPDELHQLRTAEAFANVTLSSVEIPDVSSGLLFAVGVTLAPVDLYFTSNQESPRLVCVTYSGALSLFTEFVRHEHPDLVVEWEPGRFPPPEPPQWNREVSTSSPGTIGARGLSAEQHHQQRATTQRSFRGTEHQLAEIGLAYETGKPLRKIADIGTVTLEICCRYDLSLNVSRVRADVRANLASATFTFAATGADAERLYGRYLRPREWLATTTIAPSSRIKLVPTISPAGRTPPNVTVTELPDVEARAFHLGMRPNQALAVAFDLRPGCVGTIEAVRHFISLADYGVIGDEYVLDRIMRLKWRLGGFLRSLPIERPIEVQRGPNVECATLRGELTVDGLDQVSIETDSNTRTDYIRIGGSATARATDVLLGDGTVVSPPEVTGAEPQATRWTVFTGIDTVYTFIADPLLREFARRAREDAIIHLTRPFIHPWASAQITPVRARVAGVTRHVMALGQIRRTFV